MSDPLSKSGILFRQRLLKSCGYYQGKLDSAWGPKTDAADDAFNADAESLRTQLGAFDAQTEAGILTLHIKAQKLARKFMAALAGFQYQVKIISGTRTYEKQDELYRQGRWGNPGNRVTNARGGESNHNFGIAWDIGLFSNGKYLTGATSAEDQAYDEAAAAGVVAGLEWGGNWTSILDKPHYQATATVPTVAEVRARFEKGQAYL